MRSRDFSNKTAFNSFWREGWHNNWWHHNHFISAGSWSGGHHYSTRYSGHTHTAGDSQPHHKFTPMATSSTSRCGRGITGGTIRSGPTATATSTKPSFSLTAATITCRDHARRSAWRGSDKAWCRAVTRKPAGSHRLADRSDPGRGGARSAAEPDARRSRQCHCQSQRPDQIALPEQCRVHADRTAFANARSSRRAGRCGQYRQSAAVGLLRFAQRRAKSAVRPHRPACAAPRPGRAGRSHHCDHSWPMQCWHDGVADRSDRSRGAARRGAARQAAGLAVGRCASRRDDQSRMSGRRAPTPPARLATVGQRLAAMLQGVETMQPALADFYNSLSDDQKARFNSMGRQLLAQSG